MAQSAFTLAIQHAKDREQRQAAARELELASLRAKEAAQRLAEQERCAKREQERAQREAAAEQARQRALVKAVRAFVDVFFEEVVKAGVGWTSEELEQAELYSGRLVCHGNHELPDISPRVREVIQDRFAHCLARNDNSIIQDYFLGQRQDWFLNLYNKQIEAIETAAVDNMARGRLAYSTTTAA